MAPPPLNKVEAKTAAEICARFELGEQAKLLPREGIAPAAFLERLIGERQFLDAVRFLAYALPKREAIWWAARCARLVAGAASTPEQQSALEVTERWCAQPSEELRRAAMAASEKAQLKTPAGCVALAVFFSGGSLAPPDVPVVPPADDLTARTVAGAVLMAAVVSQPEKAEEKYPRFLEQGIAVASGQDVWK
ncbi:MAG TPA: hypothetical protein VNH11_20740 [Pirellulales bacterium]|nr:hypothetical protein [Pirellulales bacterium]